MSTVLIAADEYKVWSRGNRMLGEFSSLETAVEAMRRWAQADRVSYKGGVVARKE